MATPACLHTTTLPGQDEECSVPICMLCAASFINIHLDWDSQKLGREDIKQYIVHRGIYPHAVLLECTETQR